MNHVYIIIYMLLKLCIFHGFVCLEGKGMSDNVICPDGQQCPDGHTCCPVASNSYDCCPMLNAVCCQDRKHCCPSGTFCDNSGFCYSAGMSSLNYNSTIVCPGGTYTCPSGNTCCAVGDKWGCCPFENAVCCSDQVHCCPEHYICSDNGCQKNV